MNQKTQRILKMHRKGLEPAQIAVKLGYGGPNLQAGIERVISGLKEAGIVVAVFIDEPPARLTDAQRAALQRRAGN